jgi:trans-2-enoyl-CoA reductase
MIREFGQAASVVEYVEREPLPCGEGQLRVRMLASPINPADTNWIEGTYGTRPALPEVPGTEGIAEVVESRGVGFAVGDWVIFLDYAHGWQESRVVVAADVLLVPQDVNVLDLAMLKVNPATAWLMLERVRSMEKPVVLQNAANSGVGRCVIQIARARGWRTVNFVRNVALEAELIDLGADAVFSDDEAGLQAAKLWLQQEKANISLALNAVGGESAVRQLNLLADGGMQVTYGAMGRRPVTVPNQFLIFRDMSLRGFWLSRWLKEASRDEVAAVYEELVTMMRAGQLQQMVDSVHDLAEYAEAFARHAATDRHGKVLFRAK